MSLYYDFAFSEQGFNHIRDSKECQDSSGTYSDEKMTIIAVADGHGSDNYPRTAKGSKYAVDSAIEAIKEFVTVVEDSSIEINPLKKKDTSLRMRELEVNILKRWHEKVDTDVNENPFVIEEMPKVSDKYKEKYCSGVSCAKAYGTTLIAICFTDQFWFGLQIGDGKCVAFNRQLDAIEPIPWDENCQLNVTTSICDADAIDEFRFFCDTEKPIAVFIGSDGIDDSYANNEELHAVYLAIFGDIVEQGIEVGKQEVFEFLPKASQHGSGDDVSIAGIVASDLPKEFTSVIRAKAEYDAAYRTSEEVNRDYLCAQEKLDYISEAKAKAKKSLDEVISKQETAQVELERIAAKKQKYLQNLAILKERLENSLATLSYIGKEVPNEEVLPVDMQDNKEQQIDSPEAHEISDTTASNDSDDSKVDGETNVDSSLIEG